MTIQVIGAGFGRTGTLSLKAALEALGRGPCHHMTEVIGDPVQPALWLEAARVPGFDFARVLGRYSAAVDWPACFFWRELLAFYPAAKVILTVRDGARWYESVRNTIYNVMYPPAGVVVPLPAAMVEMGNTLIRDLTFAGTLPDAKQAIAVFEHHNQAVIAGVPAARLLVYRLEQGWEPLCQFLGTAVPATPFPQVNSTDEWRQQVFG